MVETCGTQKHGPVNNIYLKCFVFLVVAYMYMHHIHLRLLEFHFIVVWPLLITWWLIDSDGEWGAMSEAGRGQRWQDDVQQQQLEICGDQLMLDGCVG